MIPAHRKRHVHSQNTASRCRAGPRHSGFHGAGCYSVPRPWADNPPRCTSRVSGSRVSSHGSHQTAPLLAPMSCGRRGMVYEARIAAQIHHPNVRRCSTSDERARGPSRHEYVLGDTVPHAQGGHRCPCVSPSRSRAMLCAPPRSARGTRHERRALEIVHRNVCPENILVGVDGRPCHRLERLLHHRPFDAPILPTRGPARSEVTSAEQLMGWPIDGAPTCSRCGRSLGVLVGARPFRNHGARQAFLAVRRTSHRRRRSTSRFPQAQGRSNARSTVAATAVRYGRAICRGARRSAVARDPSGVAAYVEEVPLSKVGIERAWLAAIHAPYDRVSTPVHRVLVRFRAHPSHARRRPSPAKEASALSMSRVLRQSDPRLHGLATDIPRHGPKALRAFVLGCLLLGIRRFGGHAIDRSNSFGCSRHDGASILSSPKAAASDRPLVITHRWPRSFHVRSPARKGASLPIPIRRSVNHLSAGTISGVRRVKPLSIAVRQRLTRSARKGSGNSRRL